MKPVASETITSTMFCRHCGYNLHGLPANRCPECGHAFDPHDPKTYWRHAASLTRRRWAKRSIVALLTLLILATAAGVSLWYPWHREQAAMQMVQSYRGYRSYLQTRTIGPRWLRWLLGKRDGFLLQRTVVLGVENAPITDTDLATLKGLPHLRLLGLDGDSNLTDAALMNLKDLKQLQGLGLDKTKVTDAGLEYLEDLTQLEGVSLEGTQVTDVGLEHLKGLTRLQSLSLESTHVTDAGLDYLKDLKRLQFLNLGSTQVTDAGLERLKDLKELQMLALGRAQVTNAGVAKLQNALPNCHIWH